VGLENYRIVLHNPVFWQSVEFTILYCLVGVFGSWVVGLALALLLRKRMYGRSFLKTLLLLPWVVPVVVTATAWKWLVATPSSVVPRAAQDLGLGQLLFLDSPGLAKIIVCAYKIWLSFPVLKHADGQGLALRGRERPLRSGPGGRGQQLAAVPPHHAAADRAVHVHQLDPDVHLLHR
jgi:multiple sugar transport system permease protein